MEVDQEEGGGEAEMEEDGDDVEEEDLIKKLTEVSDTIVCPWSCRIT